MRCMWWKGAVCATAVAMLALAAGCTSMADVRMAEAKSAMLAGDARGATVLLNQALEEGPTADAHYYLALIEHQKGTTADSGQAMAHVQQSIRLEPSGRAFLLRGVLEEGQDPQAAEASYRLGLDHARDGSESEALLHRNLGALLARRERWDEAADQFGAYMKTAETKRLAVSDAERALWGTILFQQGQDEGARTAWNAMQDTTWRRRLLAAAAIRSDR